MSRRSRSPARELPGAMRPNSRESSVKAWRVPKDSNRSSRRCDGRSSLLATAKGQITPSLRRRSRSRRQSTKGGGFPPTQFPSPRTNIFKLRTNTLRFPHTNCSPPRERNPRIIPVFLLAYQNSIIRQPPLSLVHSHILCMPKSLSCLRLPPCPNTLRTELSIKPPPPLRGLGLQWYASHAAIVSIN